MPMVVPVPGPSDAPTSGQLRLWDVFGRFSETVEVVVLKHPYWHPYGIALCVRWHRWTGASQMRDEGYKMWR